MNDRLCHDTAVAMANALLDVIAPCLREEERLDALQEFYQVCRAGLEAHEILANRLDNHTPSRN